MANYDLDLITYSIENLDVQGLKQYALKNHEDILAFMNDIAKTPFDREAYLAAGRIAFAVGASGDPLAEQIDELGKAVLRKAADHFADDSELLSLLGENCLADEEYEEAIKWLEKAFSAPETTNWTIFLLGLAHLRLNNFAESLAYFKMCKYFTKENNSWKFIFWGKDCASEIEFLEILSDETPEKAEIFWALGVFNMLERDIEKGKECFGKFSPKNYLLFDACQWLDPNIQAGMAFLSLKLKPNSELFSAN